MPDSKIQTYISCLKNKLSLLSQQKKVLILAFFFFYQEATMTCFPVPEPEVIGKFQVCSSISIFPLTSNYNQQKMKYEKGLVFVFFFFFQKSTSRNQSQSDKKKYFSRPYFSKGNLRIIYLL